MVEIDKDVKPTPKVTAAAVGGAVATVGVFVASVFGVDFPPGVEAAIATLACFGLGYIIKES